ncbi:MAG: hypothetical protein WCQ64_17115 [Acidobacteriota bacterium]
MSADDPAAIMAERPRIVRTLQARPGSSAASAGDPFSSAASGATRPVREVDITDLPPAEGDAGIVR